MASTARSYGASSSGLAVAALAWIMAAAHGCSDDESSPAGGAVGGSSAGGGSGNATATAGSGGHGNGTATGGTGGSPEPPPIEPSGCAIPTPPDLGTLESRTVGTGTPTSCTEQAVRAAFAEGGRIDFDCGPDPTTIDVTSTLLIGQDAHIRGDDLITFDAAGAVRIVRTANSSAVILEGLTFRNGHAIVGGGDDENGAGGAIHRGWQANLYVEGCRFFDNHAAGTEGFGGGAIYTGSAGWLTVVESVFQGNQSPLGGAIHTILSDLTVVDSVFSDNDATDGDGGAIFTDGGYVPYQGTLGAHDGLVALCGSRFVANTATKSAGAGFLFTYRDDGSGHADRLVVDRCEFRANRVSTTDPGLAGAIRIDAEAVVSSSLFVDNETAGQGGAVWMGRGPASFVNVTFHGNHADLWGGAISYHDRPIELRNCTVARNTAGEGSDGLFGADGNPPAVDNTLFYENGTDGSHRHCRHAIVGAHNMAFPATDDDACGAAADHVDPQLAAALTDNGGFTETVELLEASPAIDEGVDCPSTDQRGEPRDTSVCDLGAYERQP